MWQAGSDSASDKVMLLGAWHLQQLLLVALECECASSWARSRRCQKVAVQPSSMADASRSAKKEIEKREMGYLVTNVGNSCSCRPPSRRFRYSFTCFCLEAIAATRSQRWLLWSYVIVVAASWETVTVSTWLSNHSHTYTYTHTLHTIAAVRLSIVLRANSSQPAPTPPTPGPALLL